MDRCIVLILISLSVGITSLAWGGDPGRTQPPKDAQSQAAVQSTLKGTQKTAYQRRLEAHQKRQEARKRLQGAIEERKAQRATGAVVAVPDNDGKGVAK